MLARHGLRFASVAQRTFATEAQVSSSAAAAVSRPLAVSLVKPDAGLPLAPVKPNVHPLGRKVFAMVQLYQRQYEVSMNDVLVVHKLKGVELGQTIRFDQVVSARGQDFKLLGQPFISPDYVSVKATVIEHLKGEKLTIFKHRRRKNSQRTRGHRQQLTALRICEVTANV